jgi:hypothetical protein
LYQGSPYYLSKGGDGGTDIPKINSLQMEERKPESEKNNEAKQHDKSNKRKNVKED